MIRLLLAVLSLAIVATGCGASADTSTPNEAMSSNAALCDAVLQLDGNREDFLLLGAAETAEDYFGAIDRMTSRAQSAVESLRAVKGPAASLATTLADMEEGLPPVLDQFREVQTDADWAAARDAYRDWYEETMATFMDAVPRLGELGITCQS